MADTVEKGFSGGRTYFFRRFATPNYRHCEGLFDHFVGGSEQLVRNGQAERLGCL